MAAIFTQYWIAVLLYVIQVNGVDVIECTDKPVDLVIVLDRSARICHNDGGYSFGTCGAWNSMKNFSISLIQRLQIGSNKIRVAVVAFDTISQVVWNLERHKDSYKNEIIQHLNEIKYTAGESNLYAGLHAMRTQVFDGSPGDRPDVMNVALILTKSVPTINDELTPVEAQKIHNARIKMVAVGVAGEKDWDVPDEDVLRYLATPPAVKDRDWFVALFSHTSRLNEVVKAVTLRTCVTEVICCSTPSNGSLSSNVVDWRYMGILLLAFCGGVVAQRLRSWTLNPRIVGSNPRSSAWRWCPWARHLKPTA